MRKKQVTVNYKKLPASVQGRLIVEIMRQNPDYLYFDNIIISCTGYGDQSEVTK